MRQKEINSVEIIHSTLSQESQVLFVPLNVAFFGFLVGGKGSF